MDNASSTSLPMSGTSSIDASRLDIDSDFFASLLAQNGWNDEMNSIGHDLEVDLASSQRGENILLESMGGCAPDLLHQSLSPWQAQCGPLPARTDEGVGSYYLPGHELEIMESILETTNSYGVDSIVNPEPGSTDASFNNGQTMDIFDSIPGIEGLSNHQGIMAFQMFDENAAVPSLDDRLGSSNTGDCLGTDSFGNRLENMIFHETLSLENLDPNLDSSIFNPSLMPPNFDNGLYISSFDGYRDRQNYSDSNPRGDISPLYPPPGAVNGGHPWSGFEVSRSAESPCIVGTCHLSRVHNTTEISPEIGLAMDSCLSNMSSNPHWSTQNAASSSAWNRPCGSSAAQRQTRKADVEKVDANPMPKVVRKRNRHSDDEWEEADKHIRRLYVDKGHTAEEVEFEMFAIHGFKASLSKYQKRVASLDKDTRSRAAKKLPKATRTPLPFEIISEQVRKVIVEKHRRERQLQIEKGNKRGAKKKRSKKEPAGQYRTKDNIRPCLSTVYIHQEELFHAIDTLIKGLFAAGGKSWGTDAQHFKPPLNTPDCADTWRHLSDQVSSVSMLVDGQLYHHANFILGQMLAGLRVVARVCDPSSMVYFWTICHALLRVPVRVRRQDPDRKEDTDRRKDPGSPWLGWFLRQLKQLFSSSDERPLKHPLVVIVNSLLHIWTFSPDDLKLTLGLGHWKAIHTLGGLIGNRHNIILNMGSCSTKIWKNKFSASSTIIETLHKPLMADTFNDKVEENAEVSLNYLCAASKEKYNEPDVIDEASQILSWTSRICSEKAHRQELQYDSVTRAFVFSSELIATHHLETWKQPEQKENKRPDRELSYKCMDNAIDILRSGDLQCRIRAASFSKRLSTWIKGHRQKANKSTAVEEKKRVTEEKDRTAEIIRHITKERIEGPCLPRRLPGVRRAAPRDKRRETRNRLLESLLA